MNKSPCYNCKDRVPDPNCHITCERYLLYVKESKRIREEKLKEKQVESDMYALGLRRGKMGGINLRKVNKYKRDLYERSKK